MNPAGPMPSRDRTIACSLGASDAAARGARWRALADAALIDHERTPDGARHTYRAATEVASELSELIELEAGCCAFLEFELSRGERELVLEVRGPAEAMGIIELFASAGRTEG